MALLSLTTHLSLISLVFHLVLPMTVCLAQAAAPVKQYGYEYVLNLYLVEIYGCNATVKPVAGVSGEFWSPATFGTILVGDNPLVEKPSPYSRRVGRAQGVVVVASKDGRYNYETSSHRFTTGEYNGSTLETRGTFDRLSGEPSELLIVGGTKQLMGARGIIILQALVQAYNYTVFQVTYKFSLLVN